MKQIEYRVRPVTRYMITRFEQDYPEGSDRGYASSGTLGEFDNLATANKVCAALAANEPEAESFLMEEAKDA